ncbi:MAG: serine/threonine protein kinase [Deltaproteobacteria bacterium]|nr:serine/threonine protein kinase [Deltaproteobacteria bacterium]
MDHPRPEELKALAEGTQGPNTNAEAREHVSSCVSCAAEVMRLAANAEGQSATGIHGKADHEGAVVLDRGASIGRYIVLDVLGKGAMGVVYAAYDPELDRKVAIKLLQTRDGSAKGAEQAWLLREAQALAKLSHPNVTAVHDVGTLGGDRVFVAMELVEGQTLRNWKAAGTHTQREILDVYRAAGAGLAAAHAAGLVHRDFKPDNVQVGSDGRVRVLDFGLARLARPMMETLPPPSTAPAPYETALEQHLTQVGQVVGTPAYMAPEQWEGLAADARVDQFAFGVALYEALYGERPFKKPYRERTEAERWKVGEPPAGSHVPTWLRRICLRAVAEKPEARFPSMDALLAELERDPAIARRRWMSVVGGGLAIGAALAAVGVLSSRQSRLCSGAEANLAGVWDSATASSVEAAFDATGSPAAKDTFGRVRERLDRYSGAWVAMRTDACTATRIRGEQSEEVMGLRMTCLDQRLRELKSVTQILAHADTPTMNHAVEASAKLSELEPCADIAALRATVPPPDAAVRAQVEAVRGELSRAKALYDTGQDPKAMPVAQTALTEAQKIGYRPLIAEAALQLGRVQSNAGLEAAATLQSAMWAAEASRDDEVFAQAAVQLLAVYGNFERWEDAERFRPLVRAAVERQGNPMSLRLPLAQSDIDLLAHQRRNDEFLRTGRETLAMAQRELPPDDPMLGRFYNLLGTSCARLNLPCAAENARLAVQHRERTLGPRHPDTGVAYLDLADDEAREGHPEQALVDAKHALEILRALGEKSLLTKFALGNVAEAEQNLGKLTEARRDFGEVLPVLQQKLGPKHPGVCELEERLAELDLEERRFDLLGADADAASRCHEGADAADPGRMRTAALVAAAELERGEAQKALAPLQASLPLQQKTLNLPSDHFDLGLTELMLARALAGTHGEASKVDALLSDARAQFAVAGRVPWVAIAAEGVGKRR